MSYWSGGYQKIPNQYVVDLHKLAAYYAKINYGDVTLITDSNSKEFFKDAPFSTITTELDVFNGVECKNWALGKLYAYKLIAEKREPFLHIDYDVFLMKPIDKKYEEESNILVQSLETGSYKHYQLEKFYSSLTPYLKEKYGFESSDETYKAFNMGIFGCFKDYDFVVNYGTKAVEFSLEEDTKKTYAEMFKYKSWAPATITEQHYLWLLTHKQNISVTSYLNGDDKTRERKIQTDNDATDKGYVHIMGYKNMPQVKGKVYQKLKEFSLI
jgi:hypothetical protein